MSDLENVKLNSNIQYINQQTFKICLESIKILIWHYNY